MSKKHKRRATIQPMRSVRSIREVALRSFEESEPTEINDGEEFQARDGSNLRTMAEAEAEERRELRLAQPDAAVGEEEQKSREGETERVQRTIPQIFWSLVTTPVHLAIALLKIPFESRMGLARGHAT